MKKTEKYQLNQWELGDRIRMEDFNADNTRLESILEGKTGRFQKVYQYSGGNGDSSTGVSYQSFGDWSDWECAIITHDMRSTVFDKDDYIVLKLQYPDYVSSEELLGLAGGSFAVVLFPFHDKTAQIRGFVVGKGSTAVFMDRPFQDLRGLSIHLRNPNSSGFNHSSSTTFNNPVWTLYGLK